MGSIFLLEERNACCSKLVGTDEIYAHGACSLVGSSSPLGSFRRMGWIWKTNERIMGETIYAAASFRVFFQSLPAFLEKEKRIIYFVF